MKFTKMHGCGNDYVYINTFSEKIPEDTEELKKLVIALSDRHFGVGGDGVIFIRKGKLAPFEMMMYNADGSYSEMCGNGIRCVAKYIYDKGLSKETELDIESGGAVKHISLTVATAEDEEKINAENKKNKIPWRIKAGEVLTAKVNMGPAILNPDDIPVVYDTNVTNTNDDKKAPLVLMEPIYVGDKEFKMTCVSMGNPHAVVFTDELISDEDILKYGPLFETHERFPKKVNTEFVKVIDEHNVEMRVWERGTGETLACGTGSCAVTVAAILNGFCKSPVNVKLLGGSVTDEWKEDTNEVFMSGPAITVFEGE